MISDAGDDTESITSEIFGAPDPLAMSTEERRRKRSLMLGRLDEDNELGGGGLDPAADADFMSLRSGTKARPVARRSISRELFEIDRPPPSAGVTSARPVARRSVSRELFDPQLMGPASLRAAPAFHRERSLSRELEALSSMDPLSPPPAPPFYGAGGGLGKPGSRSVSLSRHGPLQQQQQPSATSSGYLSPPSRAPLSSQGRSLTQNEFFNPRGLGASSRVAPLTSSMLRESDDLFGGGGGMMGGGRWSATGGPPPPQSLGARSALDERGRSDWRRVSVPERGKDFKSLPRKYNR